MSRDIARYMLIASVLCLWADLALPADPADREFAYAQALSQRDLDPLAVIVMERFVKDYPAHPRYEEALVARGRYLQKMGDLESALAAFEQFVEKYSYSRFKVEAQCRSAELCYDLRRWPQAAQRLQALLDVKEQLSPDWIMRARYYLARCRAETGQYDDAMKRFRDFAALCPDSDLASEAQLAVGDCLRRLRRYEDAFAAYGRVMGEARGPLRVAAAFGMGMACLEGKEYPRAVVAFGEVLRADAKSSLAPQALLRRSECLLAIGDRPAARGCLSQIVTEFPNDPAFAEAVERLGQLLLAEPSNSPLSDIEIYGLILAQIRAKQLPRAASALEQAPKRDKNVWRFRACVALAAALQEAGNASDAAAWYTRAAALGGDDSLAPLCLLNAADLCMKTGQNAEAARLLEQFLASHPEHEPRTDSLVRGERADLARWNLAQLYLKDRRYAEAASLLELVAGAPSSSLISHPSSLILHPPSLIPRPSSLSLAGMAWALAGDCEKAVSDFKRLEEKGVLTAPPQYLFAYADALTRTNAAGHAADILRKLSADITAQGSSKTPEINALFLWANYLLGVICERAGDWQQAVAAFAQVDDPSAPSALRADALLHRAIALYRGGRSDECAALLAHQLMKRYPSKPLPLPAYAWLAGELLRAGDIVRSSRVCDTLAERAGSQARYKAFAQLMQARCAAAFTQPKWDEAASLLQDLVKEGGADAACDYAAKRLLADCLHALGKDSEAEELLHAMASQSHGRAAAEAEVALAQRLHDMGRPAEAAAVYQHAILVFDTPATRDLVAACLAGLATCEDEIGRPARARLARQRLTEVTGNQ